MKGNSDTATELIQWKNFILRIPAEDASAKLHVIALWAYHNGLPCGHNWWIPQAGNIGAQLLCMETKRQKVFSDLLCQLASAEGC
jgi:hypothetical protein